MCPRQQPAPVLNDLKVINNYFGEYNGKKSALYWRYRRYQLSLQ